VIQLAYGSGSSGSNPHTAIIRLDYNEGTDNWLDCNWHDPWDYIVRKHSASIDASDTTGSWILRLVKFSNSGFTIYRP
jgi:hypothetical protein